MTILATFLLLASAQPAAAEPMPAEIHNFADWAVACDNGNLCQAVSLVPEARPEPEAAEGATATPQQDPWERYGVLRLEREAGPSGKLAMILSGFEGTPARLTVYDNQLAARIVPEGEGEWRIEPTDMRSFVDNLYGSTNMLVQDAQGRTLAEIALNGAVSALVYMEERQGRLHTQGSVARPGRRPDSVVPAAPLIPTIRAADGARGAALTIPAARLTEARRAVGCTEADVGVTARDPATTHALGDGKTLVIIGCGSGAYNMSSVPLIAWREGGAIRIEPARFDVSRDPGEGEPDRNTFPLTNADFDPAMLTFSEYAKGRGIGDCGVSADYVWDGERFRLTGQREMSVCRGTREMLSTWRADVTRQAP